MTRQPKSMVPKVRFKGFTDEWEQRKLGEIGETFSGLSGKNKNDFGHGDANFITYMNVFSNSIADLRGTEHVEIDSKQNQVIYGDILFTTSSETSEEVGMSSIWLGHTKNTYLNSFCFGYRILEKQNFDSYYMAYLLRTENFRKRMTVLAQGISRYNISKKQVMNTFVNFPTMEEQRRIGKTLFLIDKTITLHEEKQRQLERLKKALLQKMFADKKHPKPELRFKGFSDDWEQRKLENMVHFFNGLTYKPNDIRKSGTFVIRSSNIQNGAIVSSDDVFVRNEIANSTNVKIGDIIVVVRNGSRKLIGKHAIVTVPMNNTVIGAFMTGIRTEHYNFINALLSTLKFKDELRKNMGATINQITGYMFSNMKFMFPNDQEMDRIGTFLRKLDNLITLQQKQIDKLNSLKKSLLQNMFI